MRVVLLLLVLVAPVAAAGVPFEIALRDHAGDTVDKQGRPHEAPSADILNFTSEVVNGTVVQRIELAAPPQPPRDWVLVRSWFANSTNGSFHSLDIEVTDEPKAEGAWVVGILRDGAFHDAREIPMTWRIEGNAWIFEFDAALVENATCFDPGIFTRGFGGEDGVYPGRRRCAQAPEPVPPTPTPRINASVISGPDPARQAPAPTVEAPGTRTPAPGVGTWGVGAVLVLAAWAFRRR